MYAHPFLQRAARGSIEILLHLIDSPEDIDGLGHLSGPERKKEKAKIKKRKEKDLKVFEEKEKAQADEAKWNGKENAREEVKDLDPFGEKILQRNYLAECGVWCGLIAPFRIESETICGPDTLALVCDVMIRRLKYLPAVRALSTGLSAHPRHPALSLMLVKFALKIGGGGTIGGAVPNEIKTIMQAAVMQEVVSLLGGTVLAFIQGYVEKAQVGGEGSSLSHRVAAAKMSLIGDKASGKATALTLLVGEWGSEERGVTVSSLEGVISVSRPSIFLSLHLLLMNLKYVVPSYLLRSIHFMANDPDKFVTNVHNADCQLIRHLFQSYCFYINTVLSKGLEDGSHVSRGFELQDPCRYVFSSLPDI